MKQLVRRGGIVEIVEAPVPQAPEGFVTVANHYSLISSGTETAAVTGTGGVWGVVRRASSSAGEAKKSLEIVRNLGVASALELAKTKANQYSPIGYSSAGMVVEGTERFPEGTRVACMGSGFATHAEFVAVPRLLVTKVPDTVDLHSASFGALACIAMHGIRRLNLQPGALVAVIGLGLIGQLAVRLLAALGYRVCGVDPVERRVALATAGGALAGATALDGLPGSLRKSMPWRTEPLPIDGALVCAATSDESLLDATARRISAGGRIIVVGDVPLTASRKNLYRSELDIGLACSYGPGRYDPSYEEGGTDYPRRYVPWTEHRQLQLYLELLAERRLSVDDLITETVPLEEASEAYRNLRDGGLEKGIAFAIEYPAAGEAETPRSTVIVREKVSVPLSDTVRLGIIGAGSYVQSQHGPILRRLEDLFSVHGVASRTGLSATSLARDVGASVVTTDHRELLSDPSIDAVLIATRHSLHTEMVLEALQAGKHVFVEKPMCLTATEGRRIVEESDRRGLIVRVGFNRRFAPMISWALQRFGRAGVSVESTVIRVNVSTPPGHWSFLKSEGGRFLGEGVHFIDLAHFLLGDVTGWSGEVTEQGDEGRVVASAVLSNGSEGSALLSYHTVGSSGAGKEFLELSGGGLTVAIRDYRTLHVNGRRKLRRIGRKGDKGQLGVLEEFGAAVRGESPTRGADARAGLFATEVATSLSARSVERPGPE